MGKLKTITRRGFLVGSAAIAGGAAFGVYNFKTPIKNPLLADLKNGEVALTPFIKITSDGVTLITPRADKGQGSYSMQMYLLAEELDVDPLTVQQTPGKPDAAYYNGVVIDEGAPGLGEIVGKLTGMQITGGSSTVPDMFVRLRYAGAVARETLKLAAANKFGADVASLKTENGSVVLADGRRVPYTELASAAASIEPVQDVTLRDEKQWRYLGKNMQRVDITPKSTGTEQYGIDKRMKGMLFATVRANPAMGAGVASYDASKAEQMLGVEKVVSIQSGVAVIATNTWLAFQAANAIDIVWNNGSFPSSSAEMWRVLEDHAKPEFQNVQRKSDGDVDVAFESGEVLEAEYRAPHLAHAPLEPMNAVVLVTDEAIDIWTGTQIPRFIEDHVAAATGRDKTEIRLHVEPMGGSFGRRLEDTYVLQAVEIAQAMKGTPVKMTWSREEDMAHDYPRPMALAKAKGKVSGKQIDALKLDLVSASLMGSQMGRLGLPAAGPDAMLTTGADDQPFAFNHYQVTGYKAPEMVPISSWRSVAASQNGFFHECFIDELVSQAGADPIAERIRLCNDEVSRKVLEEVAQISAWSGANPEQGRGRGVAFVRSFGVPVAEVIDVTMTDDGIRIDNVFVVADVGKVLDPINFEAQVYGAVIYGLGHAINSELTYENYKPQQTNYHTYQGMRLYQTPNIVVKGLENAEKIRGIGEPGLPPAAPALANAIFAATGKRMREMPFNKHIDFV
ncbi:MAG: molybdopterin-dependent oxidoreductase [Gammaproteobacteria bacterium]|nr:molybdopterin-dependent oxidoreductase [Gammaproteobacteria bacterium]